MERKGIHVRCTNINCTNKRLFDVETEAVGVVTIKCAKCGTVVCVNLENVTAGKRHLSM